MSEENMSLKEVTIIYYRDKSLDLLHSVEQFFHHGSGRVRIPDSFKEGKSIVAVCDGPVKILNQFGDRIEFNHAF